MDQSHAENMAIDALTFIVSEPETLERFMALSGLESQDLRRAAQEPGFLAGVLDFLCEHEAVLLAYSATKGLPPDAVVRARAALGGLRTPEH